MRNNRNRRGSAILEFTLAGIPMIFLIYSTVQLTLALWNYETVGRAVRETSRYVVVHGQGCTTNGNSCGVTVGTIAQKIGSLAIGIQPSQLNVTLTTASGSTKSCAPLSTCYTDSTAWPPSTSGDNAAGKNVTVSAKYVFGSTLALFWPGAGSVNFGTIALPATSTQQIIF